MQLAIAQAIETDFLSDECMHCNKCYNYCEANNCKDDRDDITNCKYETNSCDTDSVAVSICRQLTIKVSPAGWA